MNPFEFFERRILAEEARSLILDRLSEPALAHLGQWFASPHGGDRGAWLLREHPILDTVLEQGSQPLEGDVLPPPPAVALDQFCCGLLLGAFMQDAGGEHSPFYSATRIADVQELLREHSPGVCRLLTLYAEQPTGRAVLSEALDRTWPEIHALLMVTHRMSGAKGPLCQRNRMHFYAGLLGAGVEFRSAISKPAPKSNASQPVQGLLFGNNENQATTPTNNGQTLGIEPEDPDR